MVLIQFDLDIPLTVGKDQNKTLIKFFLEYLIHMKMQLSRWYWKLKPDGSLSMFFFFGWWSKINNDWCSLTFSMETRSDTWNPFVLKPSIVVLLCNQVPEWYCVIKCFVLTFSIDVILHLSYYCDNRKMIVTTSLMLFNWHRYQTILNQFWHDVENMGIALRHEADNWINLLNWLWRRLQYD